MKFPLRRTSPFGRALLNVAWLLTGKGVGAVLSLVYLALATRSLGREAFGQFMLILSTGQAAAALVGFQTWQIVVRYGMAHLERGRGEALARLVRFCTTLDIGAALAGCGLSAAALLLMRSRFGWSEALTLQAVLFCVVLLLSFRSTAVGILRLHDRYGLGATADAVTPIVRFIGATVAVWQHATVTGFLIAWALAEVVTAAVYWISAARTAPGVLRGQGRIGQTAAENEGLWHFAFVTNMNSTLNAVSRQFIVVLVGFLTGAAAAGSYRLAYQLSQSLVRVSEMFSRGVFPEVTRADASETRTDLHTLVRQSVRLSVAAGLVTCLLAPLLGLPVLQLVAGKSYLGAYPILVVLGIAAGLDIMTAGFEPVLLGTGRAGLALRIRIAAALALFAGVVLLIPSLGVIGAAFATLLGSAVALALLARTALRLARAARGDAAQQSGSPTP